MNVGCRVFTQDKNNKILRNMFRPLMRNKIFPQGVSWNIKNTNDSTNYKAFQAVFTARNVMT